MGASDSRSDGDAPGRASSDEAQVWRKVATATWRRPSDPQIYGDIEVDAEALLAFIDEARRVTGVRVTVTHVVGKAVAHALGEHPDLNVLLSGTRFVPHDSVDIFFVASVEGGRDLSGVKIDHADRKSVVEIAQELSKRVGRIRTGDDAEFGKTKRLLAGTPVWVLRPALRALTWLTVDRGVDLKRYGLPRRAFGSAIVTSVGMFGIQHAYGPLSPQYRVAMLALVSEVRKKPVVVDDEVVARPVLSLAATLDHRYLDGAGAARLARSLQAYLGNPAAFERLEPAPAASRQEG